MDFISVTIKDIARISGFSEATVCRALKKDGIVKPETKKRILQIALQLGYKKDFEPELRELSAPKSIGLLVPDIHNPYFSTVCRCINEYSELYGYNLLICTANRNTSIEAKQLSCLLSSGIAGLIMAPTSQASIGKAIDMINGTVPVVFFTATDNHISNKLKFNSVCVDDENAAYTSTKYLLTLGHREIYYIGGTESSISVQKKVAGCMRALSEFGIDTEKRAYYTNFTGNDVKATIDMMVSTGNLPSAFLAVNDFVALATVDALESNGISVPEDVSIIGFDNIDLSSHSRIRLTTVDQPKAELAKTSIEMLLSQVNNGILLENQRIIMEAALIIRDSCAAPSPRMSGLKQNIEA